MAYSNPAAYERFMGRWSARLAPLFVDFAGVIDGQHVLNVGCGTGSLTRALLASGHATRVAGVDPVADYVSFARQATPSSRAEFTVAPGQTLAFGSGTFDAALALLVLQDVFDPNGTAVEMARVTCRGGPVAACQWDFRDGLPMLSLMWQAAEAVAPEAVSRYRAERPISPCARAAPEELAEIWLDVGLSEVRTARLDILMEFCSFDDFWLPFLGGPTAPTFFCRRPHPTNRGTLANTIV